MHSTHEGTDIGRVSGFSLLELMVVVALVSIVFGAVVTQLSLVQQRTRTEDVKLDIFQEAREFGDQIMRDLHQAGYPSVRMFDTSSWSVAPASPESSDSRLATGIIKISPSEIEFEGDVDGTGVVSVLDYDLVATGNNCPCLQRSQVLKSTGGTSFSNELQNVESAGTTADPIFIAYDSNGNSISSADMTTGAGQNSLASIHTVQWQIKIKAAIADSRTGQAPETTLHGQALIKNCSLAATGQSNSC
jgi:prepilin-type N-terminal cleavage/methylation domain-containing protein